MDPKGVTTREARQRFAHLIAAAEEGEPQVVTRNGEPVAAVVPIEDYRALEDAMDLLLAREAAATLKAESDASGVSLAEMIAEVLGEMPREV